MRTMIAVAAVASALSGCQTLGGPGQAGRLERQITEIEARVARVEADIAERTAPIAGRTDAIHARVSYRPIMAWAQAFSGGPAAGRTVTFQQTRSDGYITRVSRRCRIPGLVRAGHYARIHESNSTRASVAIQEFAVTPEPDGLTLRAPISLAARTQVQGQWEPPCTGSSVGTNVGVTGEANPTAVFRLRFSEVEDGAVGYTVDLVSPDRIGLELAFHLNRFGRVRFTVPVESLARQIAAGSLDLLFTSDGSVTLPDGTRVGYRVDTVSPRLHTDTSGLQLSTDVDLVFDRAVAVRGQGPGSP